jgi:low temperature requirement protein LtrA
MLLGIVVLAAGLKLTIGNAAQPHPAGQALALGGGTALFLAGNAMFRQARGLSARGLSARGLSARGLSARGLSARGLAARASAARRIGSAWPRYVTAVFALATTALGATVAIEAQLAVLLAGLVAMLAAERYRATRAVALVREDGVRD